VVYIAANPPSPVPEEEEEEDSSPRSEVISSSTFDVAHRCIGASAAEPSCAEGTSVISGLAGERDFAVDKNQKVQQEMVKLSLHKPRLKEYVAKFISEQS